MKQAAKVSRVDRDIPKSSSDPNWSILIQPDPIWTILIQSDPIWSNLIQSDPIWSNLIQSDPIWSYLILSDPIGSYLILSDPIWSYLIQLQISTGNLSLFISRCHFLRFSLFFMFYSRFSSFIYQFLLIISL